MAAQPAEDELVRLERAQDWDAYDRVLARRDGEPID